jgi:hypothetical protein
MIICCALWRGDAFLPRTIPDDVDGAFDRDVDRAADTYSGSGSSVTGVIESESDG